MKLTNTCNILRIEFRTLKENYTNFSLSVIILILPSLALMIDLVVKKDCTVTNLLGALFYPITMVIKVSF
jgi:hypothetical protein